MKYIEAHIVFHGDDFEEIANGLYCYLEGLDSIATVDGVLTTITDEDSTTYSYDLLLGMRDCEWAYDPVMFVNLVTDTGMAKTSAIDFSNFVRALSTS